MSSCPQQSRRDRGITALVEGFFAAALHDQGAARRYGIIVGAVVVARAWYDLYATGRPDYVQDIHQFANSPSAFWGSPETAPHQSRRDFVVLDEPRQAFPP